MIANIDNYERDMMDHETINRKGAVTDFWCEMVDDFILGTLSDTQLQEYIQHLYSCRHCRRQLLMDCLLREM